MGGRGSNSGGGGGGGKVTIQELRGMQKTVTSAKAAESRAYRIWKTSEGAVITTPRDKLALKNQRIEQAEKNRKKYEAAQKGRKTAEENYQKAAKRYRRGR